MDDCIAVVATAIYKFSKLINYLTEHTLFELGIGIVIMANTISIAIRDADAEGLRKLLVLEGDFYARWIFTGEIALRMIGQGIFTRGSIFRTGWTCFDFIIIMLSWINIRHPFGNLLFLRSLRLYKLLFLQESKFARMIDVFKVMEKPWFLSAKVLVNTVALSVTQVTQVIILLLFVLLMAGVLGINIVGKQQHLERRCSFPDTPAAYADYDISPPRMALWSVPNRGCNQNGGVANCPIPDDRKPITAPPSVNTSGRGEVSNNQFGPQKCVFDGQRALPEGGHFCDIGSAAVLVFQAYYTDSWTNGMFWVQEALHPLIAFLWIFLVIFGAFYLMSLTVATTALRYGNLAEQADRVIEQLKKEAEANDPKNIAKAAKNDDDGSDSDSDNDDDDDDDDDARMSKWAMQKEAEDKLKEEIKSQPPCSGFGCCVGAFNCCAACFGMFGSKINAIFFCCKLCPEQDEEGGPSETRVKVEEKSKKIMDFITVFTFQRPSAPELGDGDQDAGQAEEGGFRASVMELMSRYTWLDIFNTANVLVWFGTLASIREQMTSAEQLSTDISLLVQSCLFIGLCAFKYVGYQGFMRYMTTPGNILDLVVVAMTLIGVITTTFRLVDSSNPSQLAWRLFRLSPVLWLISRLDLPSVMERVFLNKAAIGMAVIMLLYMITLFALLGKELFHAQVFREDSDFSTTTTALHLLIEIMMGDSWNTYALEGLRTLGIVGYVYFLLYYYIANFMFLRLFIAIIIYNFELNDEEKLAGQKLLWDQAQKKEKGFTKEPTKFDLNLQFELLRAPDISTADLNAHMQLINKERETRLDQRNKIKNLPLPTIDIVIKHLSILNPKYARQTPEIYSFWQARRKDLKALADSTPFTMFILAVVCCSTVLAVINTPGEPQIVEKELEKQFDIIFMAIFGTEAVIKIISYGSHPFAKEPKENQGFFRGAWDCFDFVIIMFQVLDLLVTFEVLAGIGLSGDDSSTAWLKGLRALRIVRVIPRLMKMGKDNGEANPIRIATAALGASVPETAVVFMMLMIFCFFFSLIGMDLYMGLLYSCNDNTPSDNYVVGNKNNCSGTYRHFPPEWSSVSLHIDYSLPVPRVWDKPASNFDNVVASLKTLYQVLNRGGIAEITRSLMAITFEDQQPSVNSRMVNLVYVMFFQILGGIFVSQMVIAIIVNNLRLKSGSGLFTDLQRKWAATKLIIDKLELPKRAADDSNKENMTFVQGVQQFMQKISAHAYFEYFMTVIILANCVVLGMQSCNEPTNDFVEYVFLYIYVQEIIIKGLTAPSQYFTNPEDLSDVFITIVGAVDIYLSKGLGVNLGLGVLKLFRLLRVMRRFEQMQQQLWTISSSVGGIAAATFLLSVWIFMFSAVGSRTFARVKFGDEIGHRQNFRNLISSLLILFQVAAGESWDGVMRDCGVEPPSCTWTLTSNPAGDCGSGTAWVFFFIFVFGVNYMLLPLYIASVITFFYETNNRLYSLVTSRDVTLYRTIWVQFVGTGAKLPWASAPVITKMPFNQLRPFAETLALAGSKLGCRKMGPAHEQAAYKRVERQCRMAAQSYLAICERDKPGCTNNADPFEDGNLFLEYQELIVYLAANLIDPQPVTVVDIMFREKARDLFDEFGNNDVPPDETEKLTELTWRDFMYGKRKAPAQLDDSDEESIDSNEEFQKAGPASSFNLYQVLEEFVKNVDMTLAHYKRLRLLVDHDDEKLQCAFEEYLERPADPENLKNFRDAAILLVDKWSGDQWEDKFTPHMNGLPGAVRTKLIPKSSQAPLALTMGLGEDAVMNQLLAGDMEGANRGLADAGMDEDEGYDANAEGYGEGDGYYDDEPDEEQPALDLSDWRPCPHCGLPVNINWTDCPNEGCNIQLNFAGGARGPAPAVIGETDAVNATTAPIQILGINLPGGARTEGMNDASAQLAEMQLRGSGGFMSGIAALRAGATNASSAIINQIGAAKAAADGLFPEPPPPEPPKMDPEDLGELDEAAVATLKRPPGTSRRRG